MAYIPHAGKRHLWVIAVMLLIFSSLARADSVQTIFAVENALYGEGYNIGHADGWMDGRLRAAIKKFQAAHKLPATGNLDAGTLSAMGVPASGGIIKGNTVAGRQAAIAELGLKSLSNHRPSAQEVASKPEPKAASAPKPKPKLKPKAAPKPAPKVATRASKPVSKAVSRKVASVKATRPVKAKRKKVALKRVAKRTHKTVSRPKDVKMVKASPKPGHRAPAKPSPKPAKRAPKKPSHTLVATAAPAAKSQPVKIPAQPHSEAPSTRSRATDTERPATMTLAKSATPVSNTESAANKASLIPPKTGTAETPKPEERRGFFGTIFHALFGWL